MHKGPIPSSVWRKVILIVIIVLANKRTYGSKVLSRTCHMTTQLQEGNRQLKCWSKLPAFHGESLWLPRNSPLTSFTLFCTVLPKVLWEILYLAISSCTLNESILFSFSETQPFIPPVLRFILVLL